MVKCKTDLVLLRFVEEQDVEHFYTQLLSVKCVI